MAFFSLRALFAVVVDDKPKKYVFLFHSRSFVFSDADDADDNDGNNREKSKGLLEHYEIVIVLFVFFAIIIIIISCRTFEEKRTTTTKNCLVSKYYSAYKFNSIQPNWPF